MPADTKNLERIITEEKDRAEPFSDGIVEGILEGAREGAIEGLKKGTRDTFKDLIAGDLNGVSDIDFEKILEGIAEDTVKTTIREASKRGSKEPAEIYVRSICDRLIRELRERKIRLNHDEVSRLSEFIRQTHQDLIKTISDKLPDNPFIDELFAGIREALEEALEEELKSFKERLESGNNSPEGEG